MQNYHIYYVRWLAEQNNFVMKKWGIYVTIFYPKEMEIIKKATFETRGKAERWARNHNYPIRCVCRIEDILKEDPEYYD